MAPLTSIACKMPGLGILDAHNEMSIEGPVVTTVKLYGNPATVYTVRFRVRGVVEVIDFSGGTNDGAYLQIGGTVIMGGGNIYKVDISEPAQTFYFNRSLDGLGHNYCFEI